MKSAMSCQKILNLIPNDGCLLVFNARHRNFRTKTHGLLTVQVMENYSRGDGVFSDDPRDLYITWREE